MCMGIRGDIAELRARIGTQLLPTYVADVQALERAVLSGGAGLNARWHELRQGPAFELSTALARLDSFERALAVVEAHEANERRLAAMHEASMARFGSDFATFQPGWGECPDRKRAAANDA